MAKIFLDELTTRVFPIINTVDIQWCEENAIDTDYIDLEDYSPDGIGEWEYQELSELVAEHYDGTKEIEEYIEDHAASYLQDALNQYGIPMTIIPGTCHWHSGNAYYCGYIIFDADIDAAWVEDTFEELSTDQNFINFIAKNYSSYDGFISYMPDNIEDLYDISSPSDRNYWRLVCEIVSYIVSLDAEIKVDISGEFFESVEECGYVGYTHLNMN